ncbi:MAG: site-specific integrase [Bacteroidota bacterium]|nr:site-specific integrase [Bacteroidota bacterium]
MLTNIKITFWISRTKKNSKNLVPVYLRVAHNYENFNRATGIRIPAADWDKKAMRIRGATQEALTANATLNSLKVKVLQINNQLNVSGKPYNIHTIQKILDGKEISQLTVLKIYDEQLAEMKKLKGKDYTAATIIKYANTHLRLKQYMKFKYRRSDMFLYELNYQFISGFEAFLKQKFNNSTTTCYKHYQRFTRVIHKAMHKGYIEKYPFENYKIKLPKKRIQYLTQEEIDRIDQCDFNVERLNIIRDVFIFACYTGLAYAEVEALTPDNITKGMDGELWLNIYRKKTKKEYQVPLLPRALEILEKYKNHPQCLKRGKCLPVPSNVKFNAYLKEIGDIAGIPKSKPLVTHLARKTFASTVALSNGMNIGVLSKILGHNSIKVTIDSYGAIIDELMLRNVKDLKEKLSTKKKQEVEKNSNSSSTAHDELLYKISGLSKN